MTKHLNKRIFSVLLTAVLLATAMAPVLLSTRVMNDANAADPLEAVPTIVNSITAIAGNTKDAVQISTSIPIYSIKQYNGWSSNYMKLRDIAYYLDFDVVWNPDEPNAMRLYTNRHYLDNWVAPGPATQTKQATLSTMDIYVDDVKVTANVQPVMIDFNNYFKVRDIATIMNFWCEFGFSGNGKNYVKLDANHTYVDEKTTNELQAMDWSDRERIKDAQYKRVVEYESLVWYSGEIGTVSDKPVTYSLRDAWGNYDYTKLYLGYTNEGMNAVAQLMLDRNLISKDSSGIKQVNDGNKLNAYYRYPMIEFGRTNNAPAAGLLRYDEVTGDIGAAKKRYDSNFGVNLAIRSIGTADRNAKTEAGILSVEYDAENEFAKAREVTQQSAARVFETMNTLGCDAEKVKFLSACVSSKMHYGSADKFEQVKNAALQSGVWPQGTEFSVLYNLVDPSISNMISFDDIGTIWADRYVYIDVCDGMSLVFENLCNAAGYYYVPVNLAKYNHIKDAIWLPDDGCWIVIDASADVIGQIARRFDGTWGLPADDNDKNFSVDVSKDIYPVLDFFYMMEQIKPGGWLSSDPMQNP